MRLHPDRTATRDRMHDTPQKREMQHACAAVKRLPPSPEFRIFPAMISLVTRHTLRPFAAALLILFIGTLFWCGDAGCWSGTVPDQCASLLCALLAPHASSTPMHETECSHDCTCACHTPVLAPLPTMVLHEFTSEPASFEFVAATPVSTLPMVYHPPRG
jgi:hypothetical protein